ncbi:hypothetical protein ARAM_003763 [Aspergillus rambellii]|uniref:Endo-chitosanase n=1 Tax=Aspergillus rambellii TaxID=308745 RepID=A0A0F8UBJ1_9EURO|nr:hypothetical protein ARAM_003763 [Aspergillus rambellii]
MHLISFLLSVGLVSGYNIPDNLQEIYNQHKTEECSHVLAAGFSPGGGAGGDEQYCGDIGGAIFLHSTSGGYADMDIDCDGTDDSGGDCGNDPSGQGQTAFQSQLGDYGISDLNAKVHPYVVFGNANFDPQEYGMEPLSVMAVVCGGQLHYGIWGDTNGGDLTGEASISLAKLCFPDQGISGDNGHTDDDVLYLGFTGSNAVPGNNADWAAENAQAFEESIKGLGDQLVSSLSS